MSKTIYSCDDCVFAEIDSEENLTCWASRLLSGLKLGKRRRMCRHFRVLSIYTKPNPIGFGAIQEAISRAHPCCKSN